MFSKHRRSFYSDQVTFSSRRDGFHVSDVLTNNNSKFISDSKYSSARAEVTGVQMHEVDLLFETVRQHCPVGFPGQMYKRL